MNESLNRAKLVDSLAAAPNIEDAIPPTVDTLKALHAADSSRMDVALSLATMLLSEESLGDDRIDEAICLFLEVVSSSDGAAARCNLGVAYLLLEKFSEAVVELSKAVLMDSALVVAHLQLSRAQRVLGDIKAAILASERVVAYQPKNLEALCELASLYEQSKEPTSKEIQRTLELYHQALAIDSSCGFAQIAIGRGLVEEGMQHFEAGRVSEAVVVWGESYQKYPRAFSGDAQVQKRMRSCAEAIMQKRLVSKALTELLQADESEQLPAIYTYVQLFLLSEGLIPECYEPQAELAQRQEYWSGQTSTNQVFPYAHYRLGIVLGYLGLFDEAAHEMHYARDYLPASKHRFLRVEEVAAFFREVRDQLKSDITPVEDTSSPEAWAQCGFEDAFSQQAWRQSGCNPKEAAKWSALGVRAQDAGEWKLQQIKLEEAQRWIAVDIMAAAEAKRWLRAEISPEQAQTWRAEFLEDLSIAIQCVQLGFSDPQEAKDWLEVFLFPYEAIAWKESGFLPEEAEKWMKSGIKDPFLAKQQRDEEEAIFAAARKEQGEELN